MTEALWEITTKENFEWTKEAQKAFDELKLKVANETVTKGYFSESDATILYTDASPYAVGAALVQIDGQGGRRVISFASKKLTKTQKVYPQVHREAFAVVWFVEYFEYHLRGRPFKILTDASGVVFIFNQEADWSKRVVSRAQGFTLRLSEFLFEIEHVKGEENIADTPSRLGMDIEDEEMEDRFP